MNTFTATETAIFNNEGQQVAHIEREGDAYYVEVEDGRVAGGRYVASIEDALTFTEWKIDGRWEAVAAGNVAAPIARVS